MDTQERHLQTTMWLATRCVQDQIDRLINRGYPGLMGLSKKEFREKFDPFIRFNGVPTDTFETHVSRIPLLVVIPHSVISVTQQMKQLQGPGASKIRYDNVRITDPVMRPRAPYLLLDVDVSGDLSNLSTAESIAALEMRKRHPSSIEEAVALITHYPRLLNDMFLDLPGCIHKPAESAPVIYLDEKNCPVLDVAMPEKNGRPWVTISSHSWVQPS